MRPRHVRATWIYLLLCVVVPVGCSGAASAPGTSSLASSSRTVSPSPSPISTPSGTTAAAGPSQSTFAAGVARPLRSDAKRGAAGSPAAAGAALAGPGTALLRQLPADENAVLSPYSIYTVLAMARAGAKGQTAAQLDAVLDGDAAVQARNVTVLDAAVAAAVTSGKPPAGGDPTTMDMRPVAVQVANSVWLSPRLPVRPSYLDALAAGFGVGMYTIDFAADPEAARKTINSWVDQRTHELIPELIEPRTITVDTVLALVDAVYLSAPWQEPFDPARVPMRFTAADGSRSNAPAMSRTGTLVTASGRGWTSVSIPYRGGGLAMTLVVPDAGSFPAVRDQLPTVLRAAAAARTSAVIALTMPTFKSEQHLSLVPAMKALGVEEIFRPNADLSGIAGRPGDIFASALVHQAVITVDEKGTEAAAATAMLMEPTSGLGGHIKAVTVDRPFFYAIHDTTTGAPLFLGQITDPTK